MSKQTYEEKYKRLEEIVTLLNDENLDIDKSIELFKEGIELKKECSLILDNASVEINKIIETNGED